MMSEEFKFGDLVEGKYDHEDYYGLGIVLEVFEKNYDSGTFSTYPVPGYVEVFWFKSNSREWETPQNLVGVKQ